MNEGLTLNESTKRSRNLRREPIVGHIIQVRWVKPYPEAANHLALGEVLDESLNYLKLKCQTIHYRGWGNQITVGKIATRLIPWARIEVIHDLKPDFPWKNEVISDEEGNICLGHAGPVIVSRSLSI